MALQLQADEAAQAQLEAALHHSVRFAERQKAELRAQELLGEALAEEIQRSRRSEEAKK